MTELEQAIELLKKLSVEEKNELLERIVGVEKSTSQSKEEYLTEKRFADGVKCPYCNGKHIQRNGKARGYQQYICVDCKKYFSATTNTIISCTKLPLEKWNKYIECMMANLSIRKCAEICGINKNTAFLWRHKILDALQSMAESVEKAIEFGSVISVPVCLFQLLSGTEPKNYLSRITRQLRGFIFLFFFD